MSIKIVKKFKGEMISKTSNVRIKEIKPLIPPQILYEEFPITEEICDLVVNTRSNISKIMHGEDDRIIAIVGPCSVHDTEASLEYAKKLADLAPKLAKEILLIMRVYFEKPRTTIGWKGLINDPFLDNSFQINIGLRKARSLLIEINKLGLPCGSEFLDVISPQFIADVISWGAIGARTTESQVHRELASGLSVPVGFKNGTGGSIQIAIDAITAAKRSHHFLSVTRQGLAAIVATNGNNDCHIILRGSRIGPNYKSDDIAEVSEKLQNNGLPPYIMVDCSHGNSKKDYKNQKLVAEDIANQIASGSKNITAFMLESFLQEGNQKILDKANLSYGQSITDACLGWQDTEEILLKIQQAVIKRRKAN